MIQRIESFFHGIIIPIEIRIILLTDIIHERKNYDNIIPLRKTSSFWYVRKFSYLY